MRCIEKAQFPLQQSSNADPPSRLNHHLSCTPEGQMSCRNPVEFFHFFLIHYLYLRRYFNTMSLYYCFGGAAFLRKKILKHGNMQSKPMETQLLLSLPGESSVLLEVSMRTAFIRTPEWFRVKGTFGGPLVQLPLNRNIFNWKGPSNFWMFPGMGHPPPWASCASFSPR